VKSLIVFVPPLSFLIRFTIVSDGAMSSLVIVHVLLSPAARVTLPLESQSPVIEVVCIPSEVGSFSDTT
jgi:hypothetical protein